MIACLVHVPVPVWIPATVLRAVQTVTVMDNTVNVTNSVMHPLDNAATDAFSPGSISRICGGFSKRGTCLKDPTSFAGISAGICGNGVKENQEQCDCGQAQDCRDKCCNASTCKLVAGAQCADGNDSCCDQCKLQAAGTICHQTTGVCDKDLVLPFNADMRWKKQILSYQFICG
jgi:Disintegrin